MNKAQIIGRLGRDPEVRYTPVGVAVASFSVATSEKWRDKQTGEQKEMTEWHNVTAFGRQAEVCGQYLHKGKQVYVEGRLQTDKWEKEGVTRYSTKIILQRMEMLGSKDDGPSPAPVASPAPATSSPALDDDDDFNDDIPFAWLLPVPFAPMAIEMFNATQTVF